MRMPLYLHRSTCIACRIRGKPRLHLAYFHYDYPLLLKQCLGVWKLSEIECQYLREERGPGT